MAIKSKLSVIPSKFDGTLTPIMSSTQLTSPSFKFAYQPLTAANLPTITTPEISPEANAGTPELSLAEKLFNKRRMKEVKLSYANQRISPNKTVNFNRSSDDS